MTASLSALLPVSFEFEGDFHAEKPHPLTVEEIQEIVDKFASAALRARKAGFDGVDINAASSHLLHNFFSPFWNKRTDTYGGSIENRARFAMEVIREIKKRAGNDFPVSIILNGVEMGQAIGVPDSQCLTHEDAREIAKCLQAAGADAIQVRSHFLGYHVGAYLPDALFYPAPPIPIENFPEAYDASDLGVGANIPAAAGIKSVVSIPVTVVGKLDADLGERILREGQGRFHCNDPPSSGRPGLSEKDCRRTRGRYPAVHRLRQLPGKPPLQDQRLAGYAVQHNRKSAEEEKSPRDRRRTGRHVGGQSLRHARP